MRVCVCASVHACDVFACVRNFDGHSPPLTGPPANTKR